MTLGMDAFAIGATVVALVTGTPELATTLVARLRGHDEVGLGNLYGSNTFNGLLIVAVVALIAPIAVAWREIAVGHLLTNSVDLAGEWASVAKSWYYFAHRLCLLSSDGVVGAGFMNADQSSFLSGRTLTHITSCATLNFIVYSSKKKGHQEDTSCLTKRCLS